MSRSTLALVWLISLLFVGAAAYHYGAKHQRNADEAEKVMAITRAIDQANEVARQDFEIAFATENKLQSHATTFDRITEETRLHVQNHPEYFTCGLDADGLRLWNAANAGSLPDAPSQPDGGMPGGSAGDERKGGGPGRQPQAGDAVLPRMQGPAPGPGSVGEEGGK